GAKPGVIQAEADCTLGKLMRVVEVRFLAVLDAVEPFFLGSGDDLAVDEQGGGRLVIHRVDSKNVHRPTSSRVISSALRSSRARPLSSFPRCSLQRYWRPSSYCVP